MGGEAHGDTVKWLKRELESLDGYYDVELQEFWNYVMLSGKINSFSVGNASVNASLFDFSASTVATAPLVIVNNVGCEAVRSPVCHCV